MIIDTSVIIAILTDEPERARFLDILQDTPDTTISAGSLIELAAVITRKLGSRYIVVAEQLLEQLEIRIAPVSEEQAQIGWRAYQEFGIGTQHPAKLNFGDCFAYALAKATGEPLLFKGDDFSSTDIRSALPL
ncbi:hypothetical protein ASG11_14230 [Sphingomonas sp. Leaf357]|uniref:type II toxin-antitoxin system VapC family toxin n=1 Tax=Sphingomonas sp. Leaf357 TaxID=1736350 RepID=UPI0007011CB4|nr:type II toxin-antitoxin system VapC family toxin [Sphingomonas sp. Leaf357]KQS01968.1 hypothetical protein ASG11_14230 [Sphingomonas sp. Leaf357]